MVNGPQNLGKQTCFAGVTTNVNHIEM